MTRREFVRKTGGALAAGAALSSAPALHAQGANEKIRLGFIGVGGRGHFHLRQFAEMADVNVVAVADVSEEKRNRARTAVPGVKLFNDFRQLLELKDVDAVVVSPPDHWHAIPTILACQAGKDVYVEKPLGHNIQEGRAMVQAARKYNRVVQLGTQQRSGPTWIEAVEKIKSGELGKAAANAPTRMWSWATLGASRATWEISRIVAAATICGTASGRRFRAIRKPKPSSAGPTVSLGCCRTLFDSCQRLWLTSFRSAAERC